MSNATPASHHAIRIQSGLGQTSGEPLVGLIVNDQRPVLLAPDEARALARDLLEAAEDADRRVT